MSEEPSYRAFEARVREAVEELVADLRRQAEVDADNIRRAAASEAATLLAETERRRNELQQEIQRLERQLEQVSSGIQSLLRGQLAEAAAAAAPPVRPAAAPRVGREPPPAPPPEPPSRSAEDALTTALTRRERGREPDPPPLAEPEPPLAALEPPTAPSPHPEAPLRQRPIEPPRVTAQPEPPAPPAPPAPPTVDDEPPASRRTEVAVSGTPSFARALELQRGIQRTAGVRHVQALQFERGTLVLAVEHDASVDLTEAVQGLPNVQLELASQTDDRLEFAFA